MLQQSAHMGSVGGDPFIQEPRRHHISRVHGHNPGNTCLGLQVHGQEPYQGKYEE